MLQETLWAVNTGNSQTKQTIQKLLQTFSTEIQTIVMLKTLQVCPKYLEAAFKTGIQKIIRLPPVSMEDGHTARTPDQTNKT